MPYSILKMKPENMERAEVLLLLSLHIFILHKPQLNWIIPTVLITTKSDQLLNFNDQWRYSQRENAFDSKFQSQLQHKLMWIWIEYQYIFRMVLKRFSQSILNRYIYMYIETNVDFSRFLNNVFLQQQFSMRTILFVSTYWEIDCPSVRLRIRLR